jgi:hypothetical protein
VGRIEAEAPIHLYMDENISALGVGAFQYEVQQLLGTQIDVIPTVALQNVEDQTRLLYEG